MASGRMGNFHSLTQMKFTDEHKIGQLHQKPNNRNNRNNVSYSNLKLFFVYCLKCIVLILPLFYIT